MNLILTDKIEELDELECAYRYGCDSPEAVRSRITSDIGNHVHAIANIHSVNDRDVYAHLKKHFGKSQTIASIDELLERLEYIAALRKQEEKGKPYPQIWPENQKPTGGQSNGSNR